MRTLLLERDIKSVLKIEISREPGDTQARLVIKNNTKITGEIRARGRLLHKRTADVPDSAEALFKTMLRELRERGLDCTNIERKNLPKLPPDQNDFSATATVEVGMQSDEELSRIFAAAATAAETELAHSRYFRILERWSDRVAGTAADTMELG